MIRLLSLVLLPLGVYSANILFYFPGSNFSQMNAVWPLVYALAERNHSVVFLSPLTKVSRSHSNIKIVAPKVLQASVDGLYARDRFTEREEFKDYDFDYVGVTTNLCKLVLDSRKNDSDVKNLFQSTFDLVIVNGMISDCGSYVGLYFNSKVIIYSPTFFLPYHYDTYGISSSATGWIPDFFLYINDADSPIQFWDRVKSAYFPLYWQQWTRHYLLSPELQNVAQDLLGYYPPSLYDLDQNVSLVLLNSHSSADFARQLSPLFVEVGGMANWREEKEIPQDFKEYLDSAENGVVLITFGSTILLNTASERHQKIFFNVFEALPQIKFILRWKGPLPNFVKEIPRNLKLAEWLPQREIMRHPNLKCFVTHGGVSSIHEATYYAVPIVVLPFFSDQDINALRAHTQQVGIRVEIRGMTSAILASAIHKILSEEKYKINMAKKSAIFRDRPLSPVETAVFWVEFVLRHNSTMETFRPGNSHLNWFQRERLDVHMFTLAAIILIFTITAKVVCCAGKRMSGIQGDKVKIS